MTYLFIVIALAVINALALSASWTEIAVANALIWAQYILKALVVEHMATKMVVYDRIDLLTRASVMS